MWLLGTCKLGSRLGLDDNERITKVENELFGLKKSKWFTLALGIVLVKA